MTLSHSHSHHDFINLMHLKSLVIWLVGEKYVVVDWMYFEIQSSTSEKKFIMHPELELSWRQMFSPYSIVGQAELTVVNNIINPY